MIQNPNPQIRRVSIGRKSQREIEILPLSISDQFRLSDLLNEALQFLLGTSNKSNIAFMGFVIGLIQRNLNKILDMSTDISKPGWLKNLGRRCLGKPPIKPLLRDITNEQALEIAVIIYEINYSEIVKKVESLLEGKVDIPEPLRRLSQIFYESTPNTVSKTSMKAENGEKES